jgi:hypothetical protein
MVPRHQIPSSYAFTPLTHALMTMTKQVYADAEEVKKAMEEAGTEK